MQNLQHLLLMTLLVTLLLTVLKMGARGQIIFTLLEHSAYLSNLRLPIFKFLRHRYFMCSIGMVSSRLRIKYLSNSSDRCTRFRLLFSLHRSVQFDLHQSIRILTISEASSVVNIVFLLRTSVRHSLVCDSLLAERHRRSISSRMRKIKLSLKFLLIVVIHSLQRVLHSNFSARIILHLRASNAGVGVLSSQQLSSLKYAEQRSPDRSDDSDILASIASEVGPIVHSHCEQISEGETK